MTVPVTFVGMPHRAGQQFAPSPYRPAPPPPRARVRPADQLAQHPRVQAALGQHGRLDHHLLAGQWAEPLVHHQHPAGVNGANAGSFDSRWASLVDSAYF